MEIITITPDQLRQLIREEVISALKSAAVTTSTADDVLTLSEARDVLRVSDSTMRRMVRQKEIPSFTIHSRIFLSRVDVETWVREQIHTA